MVPKKEDTIDQTSTLAVHGLHQLLAQVVQGMGHILNMTVDGFQ